MQLAVALGFAMMIVANHANSINVTTDPELQFPGLLIGTKWCGPGNIASSIYDLEPNSDVDLCCRNHDFCPDSVRAGETKYGWYNPGYWTESSCLCDDKLLSCLHGVEHVTAKVRCPRGDLENLEWTDIEFSNNDEPSIPKHVDDAVHDILNNATLTSMIKYGKPKIIDNTPPTEEVGQMVQLENSIDDPQYVGITLESHYIMMPDPSQQYIQKPPQQQQRQYEPQQQQYEPQQQQYQNFPLLQRQQQHMEIDTCCKNVEISNGLDEPQKIH